MEEPFSQLYQLSQRYICVLLGGMLKSSGSSFGSQLRFFISKGIATGPVTRSPSNSHNIAGTVVVEKNHECVSISTHHHRTLIPSHRDSIAAGVRDGPDASRQFLGRSVILPRTVQSNHIHGLKDATIERQVSVVDVK